MKKTSVCAITAAALTFAAAAPFSSLAAYRACGLPGGDFTVIGGAGSCTPFSGLFDMSGLTGGLCIQDTWACPDAAGIAGLPTASGSFGTPAGSDSSCVPGAPESPGISDFTCIPSPDAAGISGFPYIPGTSDTPGISDLPCTPGTPDAPGISDFPCIPGTPDAPGISDFPCIPGTPDTPGVPDIPDTPDVPDLPGVPVNPDTPTIPGTPDVPGTSTPSVPDEDSAVVQIVQLVNAERAKAGLTPLSLHSTASAAALTRARETVSVFSHTRPDGRSFSTALTEAGISYSFCGENIAYGQTTPEQVMNDWMNSSGHRANILQTNFSQIGVGHYISANGTHYWVQLFLN